jgi:chromosome segregation ATPase
LYQKINILNNYLNNFFQREKQENVKLVNQINELNNEIKNIQSDSSLGQEMKNDLLLFTSKLTEKNSYLTTQIKEMSEELAYFQTNCKLKHLNESLNSIKDQLNETNEKLNLEINRNKVLENELINKEKEIENVLLKLSDEQDEILTLKKKHANNIKDLTRQLQQFKDKEMSVLDYASKTLSSSEDDLESSNANNHLTEVFCDYGEDVYVMDVDKQKLIDKIIKLQLNLAKKIEKIDFLTDHVNQLTFDLKRKTR